MLLRAMAEVAQASQRIGIYPLVLDAIDQEAKSWYLQLDFGFQEIPSQPDRLFVPTPFIDQLDLGPVTDLL